MLVGDFQVMYHIKCEALLLEGLDLESDAASQYLRRWHCASFRYLSRLSFRQRGKTILCLNPIYTKSMRGPTLLEYQK